MLEGYITPWIMSYIDKYVKNIKPSDLKLSFWGGDAVLHNLELRVDVLEKELNLPLEVRSGKIRELIVQCPWNAILSKSVELTLKDVEIVVKLKDVRLSSSSHGQPTTEGASDSAPPPSPSAVPAGQPAGEAAPGYLQGYMSRILNNGKLHICNMVVKVIEEECDMLMTWHFGSLEGYTVDEGWQPSYVYTDYLQGEYAVNKVTEVTDLVINLQPLGNGRQSGAGGDLKEPFVHRCSFVGRQREEFSGANLVKRSINLCFGDVTMSADESQFCLFVHHVNWLFGLYYSRKKLKGRDDLSGPAVYSGRRPSREASVDGPASSPPSEEPEEGPRQGLPASEETDRGGWGSWVWSMVGGAGEGASAEGVDAPGLLEGESYSLAMFGRSLTVNFRATEQVRTPPFYSTGTRSQPVLKVVFTGCLAKIDAVKPVQLYGFTWAVTSVRTSITGLCPCVARLPSSWQLGGGAETGDEVGACVDACDTA